MFIQKRDDRDADWWWSEEALVAKCAISLVIISLLCAWLIGGRLHARRRIRNGQAPLAYHRILVRKHIWQPNTHPGGWHHPHQPPPGASYYAGHHGGYYQHPNGYPMNNMPPPPTYDPDRPPVYQEGENKRETGPARNGTAAAGETSGLAEYAPPQGPPPSAWR